MSSSPSAPAGPGGGPTAPQGRGAGSRRPVIIAVVVVAVGALLLGLLAVGTVSYLLLRGGEEPQAAPTPTAPTYEAPTPMTPVETDWYTFSYPQHWQETGEDVDPVNWDYGLSTLDVVENTKMIVMDYIVLDQTWEEACQALVDQGTLYEPRPDVLVDGRTALHFQHLESVPDTGEPRIQDMWCMPRDENIVVVLGRTAGPEAEAAGISEVQKVLDTWRWTAE